MLGCVLYVQTFTLKLEHNLQIRIARPLHYNPITLKRLKGLCLMRISAILGTSIDSLSNRVTVLFKPVVFA